jgi:pyruvate dehydrogenase E2 component (dihydrolipoamide acetyltransferase)
MAIKQFRLPDVGEGLTEAEILGWSVKVGDVVKVNQILVEIETAKAAVELPSPFAGKVGALLVEAGQTVDVGTPIIEIEVAGAEPDPAPAPASSGAAAPAKAEAPKREPVLVGYGVSQAATTRRARKNAAPAVAAVASVAPVAPAPVTAPAPVPASAAPTVAPTHVLAKPLVRKLAKDLGVDLATITPAREDGVITREEVERAAATPAVSPVSAPAVTALAEDRRVPIKGVRKATAAAMVASAFTAPHVTEFLTLDATRTVELVERRRAPPEYRDG